ncbi:VOC family protein [Gilliamella apis]|uniref:VOC family protein n=1 Tax=Gilliamella apis TaxID=1970738 RepID=UPI002FFA7BB1
MTHLGSKVSKITITSSVYQTLGFSVTEKFTKKGENGKVHVAFLTSQKLTLELYELPDSIDNNLSQFRNGIEYFALEVNDIDKILNKIKALGYEINEELVYEKREYCEVSFFLISGLDGERVEFDMTRYF